MAESEAELRSRLEAATVPGFGERLVDRGLARGLIWREGILPPGAPPFQEGLTEDLLDYAHGVFAMALRLRSENAEAAALERAFLVTGEAIEAAVLHGDAGRPDRGFNRLSAAVGFHLARYAARAYSMLPSVVDRENLAPTEIALVHLLRRSFDEMHAGIVSWLLDDERQDAQIAQRLRDDPEFDETDAIHTVLTTAFMRALALFDHAITTGEEHSAAEARHRLLLTAQAAKDTHAVSHWWTSLLAPHLIDELWRMSLHQQIPILPPEDSEGDKWNSLRRSYIQRLRAGKRPVIELWPSQIEAAHRAANPIDDLVVALPTSAGKTRIAELCILRALAADRRVVYVTPLRALSAQVERDLAEAFLPLGFSVSSLYGSAGIERGDAETLRRGDIVVSTPEKLDFALRNDRSILDDVGLVVLDEGHMLGPSEREVRYEALVQRLVRRADAGTRRIVCLSALFPPPDGMTDLVAWIRQDEPGGPVHSTWRPTRQRFGVLRWLSNAARLDIKVEEESPFVPRFVQTKNPPVGSRRRKSFPSDKNELTLSAAWRFVEQDKDILIFCTLRKSVETLGRLVVKCIDHGVLDPLRPVNRRIRDAMATGVEWLGPDHPAVQCLQYGVALHHGGLPRPFLNEVERLLRLRDCPLTIASPTLAQGLNLSASVLLVPSIWRNGEIIPTTEFANVAGRAGRAFVDVEGLVLHVVWETDRRRRDHAVRQWEHLVAQARTPALVSGLLHLAARIFKRIAASAGVPFAEVVEYVTGHGDAWDFGEPQAGDPELSAANWERDVASLDAAILALLEAETEEADLDAELDVALTGSLFTRQLMQQEQNVQVLIRRFLDARTHRIWSQTSATQRKGYHVAGVGLRAGQFLDAHAANLVELLLRAEDALVAGDAHPAADAVVEFAKLVFQTAPFHIARAMPDTWENALRAWMEGHPASEVIAIGGDDGVDLLQEAFTYRLPWAMEAVRVHAIAVGQEGAESLRGIAPLAAEAGSANRAVIILIRAGLSSREGAMAAVAKTAATFVDRNGMIEWLSSEEVARLSDQPDWPTPLSRHSWLQFVDVEKKSGARQWKRETHSVHVEWLGDAPDAGTHVVLEEGVGPSGGLVLTPDLMKLGALRSILTRRTRYVVSARVGDAAGTVDVEYFGPSD